MGSSSYSYEVVSSAFNEDFYEQCVIEHSATRIYTAPTSPAPPRNTVMCSYLEFSKIH